MPARMRSSRSMRARPRSTVADAAAVDVSSCEGQSAAAVDRLPEHVVGQDFVTESVPPDVEVGNSTVAMLVPASGASRARAPKPPAAHTRTGRFGNGEAVRIEPPWECTMCSHASRVAQLRAQSLAEMRQSGHECGIRAVWRASATHRAAHFCADSGNSGSGSVGVDASCPFLRRFGQLEDVALPR